jgi:hypothetical protein
MYVSRLGTKAEPKEITISGRKHRIGTILFLLGAGLGLASCAGDVGYYSTAGPYPYGTYPYAEGFIYRGDWGYGHPHYWRHWDHRRAAISLLATSMDTGGSVERVRVAAISAAEGADSDGANGPSDPSATFASARGHLRRTGRLRILL